MKHRQWSRLYVASYGPQSRSFFSIRWLLFFAVIYTIYLLAQIVYSKRVSGFILEFILMGFVSIFCGVVAKFLQWFARLVLLEIYSFLWLFTVFHLYDKPTGYVPLLSIIIGLVLLTILNWIMYPYVLRAISRLRGGVAPKIHVDDESATPRYEIFQDAWCSAPYSCVYEGQMLNGRPHGLGSWIDTSPQGENLHGYWHRGIPIGPFESVESETRNILVSLRIIYGTIHGGDWSWLKRGPLRFGVATVETCVSGSFFKKFPICRFITENKECVCKKRRCTCIQQIFQNQYYLHINESQAVKSLTISIDRKNRRIHVPGHQSYRTRETKVEVTLKRDREKRDFSLRVGDRWIPTTSKEGLLFIHGIYHDLEDSLKRFGHFLASSHFPSHIKPFVWNWPSSSNPLMYPYAKDNAANPDYHKDFLRFLLSIRNSGINTLHIMCHSMGTRFLMHAFPMVQSIFKKKAPHEIFSDIDGPGGSDNIGRQNHVPQNPGLQAPPPPGSPQVLWEGDGMELVNLILLNPDYEVDSFTSSHQELSAYVRTITIYADSRDGALRLAHRLNSQASLGANVKALYDQHGTLLDLDIIDTGELDSNVSSSRHGFFNVSRPMVDDLYDLIINNNRAEDRSSRLRPYRSVYRFTVIPATVMDI
jgi:esterase/lipase superfamily enzyme